MNPVIWSDVAVEQLAAVYLATPAGERDRVVRAVEAVDRELSRDAATAGESRPGGRVCIEPPVLVYFVPNPDGSAHVVSVRPSRRRPRGS